MSTRKPYTKYLFLLLGLLSFAVYLTLFYHLGKSKPLVLACNKLVTNAGFIGFALMGTMENRSLRNRKLIEALIFYAVGDIIAIYSVPVGGVFYLTGHFVLIRSLYITTLIQRKNVIWYIILATAGTLALLFMFRNDLGSVPIYAIYGLILNAKLALAISNPLYLVASIIFTLSDALGVYRVINYGDSFFGLYIITIGTYYTGIVLYALTAYRYEAKPVVTWSNMTVLARNMTRGGVRFCFTQGWGRDIAAGRYAAMHSDAYISADIRDKAEAEKILSCAPDIVISEYEDVDKADALQEQLGVPVVTLRTGPNGVFDPAFADSMTLLGRIFGREERAAELNAFVAEQRAEIQQRTADIAEEDKPGVYICGLGNWGTTNHLMTAQNPIYLVSANGFVPAEESRDENAPLGTIAVDAIYTPIKKVNWTVDNWRVEQKTDYEKLNLEIITDGSIEPKEALQDAAGILIQHFLLFTNDVNITAPGKESSTSGSDLSEEAIRMRHLLLTKLSDMGLSVRAFNCLKAAEIDTFADLVSYSRAELMKFRNFGRKSLNEIDQLVEKWNLTFGMDVTKYNIEPKKRNV